MADGRSIDVGFTLALSDAKPWTSNKMAAAEKPVFRPGATQPIVGVYFTALYRALAS